MPLLISLTASPLCFLTCSSHLCISSQLVGGTGQLIGLKSTSFLARLFQGGILWSGRLFLFWMLRE